MTRHHWSQKCLRKWVGHFELQGGWYTPTLIACCGILRLRLQELYAPHLVAARADWPPAKPFTNLSTKRQQKVPRDVHGLRSCEKSSVYLCLSSKLTCTRMLNKEKQMHAHLRSHISVYLFMLLSCKMTGLEDSVCCPLRRYMNDAQSLHGKQFFFLESKWMRWYTYAMGTLSVLCELVKLFSLRAKDTRRWLSITRVSLEYSRWPEDRRNYASSTSAPTPFLNTNKRRSSKNEWKRRVRRFGEKRAETFEGYILYASFRDEARI